ncbi:MAG: hypothetical protein JO190_08565 [Candidatus Eremiobacteraeota bacterium]|nr:hypothetical protein [Candidatus Eremiobacteraeota bacterium]MBV8498079.1 hypothetical protein [Candidatus Eremiobacteraeota bacterium]
MAAAATAVTPASSASEFDVRAFGAAADGRTDDSRAVRAALAAAASAGGGIVYFPPGVYVIDPASGPFPVNSGMTIAGSGPRSVLRVRDNAGRYNLIFGQPARRIRDVAFERLRIDQNLAGNPHSDINPATDAENAIQLYDFDGVTISRVAFDPEPGIQAVVLAGPGATGVTIEDCGFEFRRGASSNPFYDNSSVYTEAANVRILGNQFSSTNAQNAVTAIEVHGGPNVEIADNESSEYQIGMNIVNSTKGYPDVERARVAAHDNRILQTTQAFDLWSVTGRTLRDVVIGRNLVTMARHRQYDGVWLGVSFVRGSKQAGIDGAFDAVTIDDNTFDFRALYGERIATLEAAGVDVAPKGALHDLVVTDNDIVAPPAGGLRIGSASDAPRLDDLEFTRNRISDAGWDPHAPARSRSAVRVEAAPLTDVHVDDNAIVGTGRYGDLRDVFSAWAHPLGTSRNVTLRDDRIDPHGVMRFSVDRRVVDVRGTRP